MKQHTGNWPGKTVENSSGICEFNNKNFLLVDIPGTYSIMSNSEEEEIARDYICFGNPNATVIILDSTCLERNLNLVYQIMEITPNVVVCVNLLDEAKKKKIKINLEKLEEKLGVPVVGTIAKKKKTLKKLLEKVEDISSEKVKVNPKLVAYIPTIEESIIEIEKILMKNLPKERQYLTRWIALKLLDGDKKILNSIEINLNINFFNNRQIHNKIQELEEKLQKSGITKENFKEKITAQIVSEAEKVCNEVVYYEDAKYQERDRKIDKILTSKTWGFLIMLAFLGIILWITIIGSNYPSQWLSSLFNWFGEKLVLLFEFLHLPAWLKGIIIDGMYKTLAWVVSVMLPPMAIFFPLFTLLEDLGVLPRIAFNLDKCFKRACTSRKTSINNVYGFRL